MSSGTLRIAHLSDLHADATRGESHFGQDRVVRAFLADIEEQAQEKPLDLIVFSGDLSGDGTEQALEQGKELLLDPLRKAFDHVPIVLTPGNHDIDRARVDAALDLGLNQLLTSREAVQQRLADPSHASQARILLQAWDNLFSAWDAGLPGNPTGPFGTAYRFERNGLDVAIGVFDTAWRAKGGMADQGRLIIGADYVRAFLEGSEDADFQIAIFHHPLEWLADFDRKAVRVALEQAHAMVLTGHNHVPDPTLNQSGQGGALYNQAACLYEHPDYANGYALVDIDASDCITTIEPRRWLPEVDKFAPDASVAPEGHRKYTWPPRWKGDRSPYRVSSPKVLEPIVDLAQEQSLLVPPGTESGDLTLNDLVVPLRFWPVPHTEVFDRSVDPAHRPSQANPFDEIRGKRALIVAGPRMSGISTALLWILDRHYRELGTHLPVYVRTDASFGLRRIRRSIAEARGKAEGETEPDQIPVIAAIDDVEPGNNKALSRLINLLREDPSLLLILGSHDHVHNTLANALEAHGTATGKVYLGHVGRQETKQLVARMAGADERDLVDKVIEFGQKLRLPRNPVNQIALASVIANEPRMRAINESGLLQSFVAELIGNPVGEDPDGLSMDYRRREHLLERIAKEIVERDLQRLPRLDIEQLVLDYLRQIGWTSAPPGELVESLVTRRVLVRDHEGVGFRYPAFLHLFAAKAANDDDEFRSLIFASPIKYAPVIRHVAGLKRNDVETLKFVVQKAIAVREEVSPGVEVGQFDHIEDRHGWSEVRDLEGARKLARPGPPSEKELDVILDDVIDEPDEPEGIRPFEDHSFLRPLDELVTTFGLAASVLQTSELVPDLDLRAEVMREVITGWSVMTILLAVEEDAGPKLYTLFEESAEKIEDEELRQSMVEHLAMLFVIGLMSVSLYMEAGSIHQQAVLEKLLDDKEFMRDSAHALFATMLYTMLRFPDWPRRLRNLYDRHGRHPMIKEVVEGWAQEEYLHGALEPQDVRQIESLLIKVRTPKNLPGVKKRQSETSKIQAKLQDERIKSRFRREQRREDAA